MDVLKNILEKASATPSRNERNKLRQDRGKHILNAQYPTYAVERARLNNADRYFNEQVFSLEKEGAKLYNSSNMPMNNSDKGKLYKIQAFANPLLGSLRGKLQLYQQLSTQVEVLRSQARGDEQTAGNLILKPDILKNNYFGTKELLTEFNAMMNYVNEYVKQLINGDAKFLENAMNLVFIPILNLLNPVILTYANFYNILPDFANEAQRLVKKALKDLCEKNYVMYSVMFKLISDGEFRPLTDSDIQEYRRMNNVAGLIMNNFPRAMPLPVQLPPQPVQPEVLPVAGPPAPRPAQNVPAPPPALKVPPPDVLAQIPEAPSTLKNASGQRLTKTEYFFVLALAWLNNEESGISRTIIPQLTTDSDKLKVKLAKKEQKLASEEGSMFGRSQAREAKLARDIAQIKVEISQVAGEIALQTARRVKILTNSENLNNYLRDVVKMPLDAEGNPIIQKTSAERLRLIAQQEPAIKTSLSLVGFGKNALVGSKVDNKMDGFIPDYMGEFEFKKMLSDKARGDRRIVAPDQNYGTRMRMFDPITELDPKFELLKQGFKANDQVMESDRPTQTLEASGYHASGRQEDENDTAFKSAFGSSYREQAPRTQLFQTERYRPYGGFFDIDGNDEFNTVKNMESFMKSAEHHRVEEEPDDILDHPDEFRKKIESYRFNTGRMKTKPSFLKAN